jgi:hypothetical protein
VLSEPRVVVGCGQLRASSSQVNAMRLCHISVQYLALGHGGDPAAITLVAGQLSSHDDEATHMGIDHRSRVRGCLVSRD